MEASCTASVYTCVRRRRRGYGDQLHVPVACYAIVPPCPSATPADNLINVLQTTRPATGSRLRPTTQQATASRSPPPVSDHGSGEDLPGTRVESNARRGAQVYALALCFVIAQPCLTATSNPAHVLQTTRLATARLPRPMPQRPMPQRLTGSRAPPPVSTPASACEGVGDRTLHATASRMIVCATAHGYLRDASSCAAVWSQRGPRRCQRNNFVLPEVHPLTTALRVRLLTMRRRRGRPRPAAARVRHGRAATRTDASRLREATRHKLLYLNAAAAVPLSPGIWSRKAQMSRH